LKKKTKNLNQLLKNNFLLLLILPISLFSLDVKKNSDSPGSEVTPSRIETNKAPLELDDGAEGLKDVERSGTDSASKKKAKKHSLTPEQLKKKKEVIEKVLKYGSNKERKEAMRELSHFSTEGLEDLVKIVSDTLANDTDNGIKVSCLRTLAELEVKTESKNIIEAVKNKSDDVKDAAIHAIQKLKVEEASEELGSFLKNQDFTKSSTLVSSTINTLAELESGKNSSEFLENKFRDKTTSLDLRSSIALYFGKIKDNKAESALLDVATDDSEDVTLRSYSVNSLGKMHSPRAVSELRAMLAKINESKSKTEIKKYSGLKLYVISALILLGDKDILKDLIVYAKDDDPAVRLRAIKQLGEVPDPNVIELVEYKAQRDPNRKVQELAKKIIEEWKQKGVTDSKGQMKNATTSPDSSSPQPVIEKKENLVLPVNR
jgi:HEAT repeat protein